MRATSLRRTVEPSFSTFRMMCSKSATVVSWLCAVMVTLSCWSVDGRLRAQGADGDLRVLRLRLPTLDVAWGQLVLLQA